MTHAASLLKAPKSRETAGRKKQEKPRETQLARLPLIDPQATTGDIRASFDRMTVKLNIFRMMAHAEANMIPAMRFANSILHKQKLSHVNRELLILQVAHIEGGEYEWRQHVPIALGVGEARCAVFFHTFRHLRDVPRSVQPMRFSAVLAVEPVGLWVFRTATRANTRCCIRIERDELSIHRVQEELKAAPRHVDIDRVEHCSARWT